MNQMDPLYRREEKPSHQSSDLAWLIITVILAIVLIFLTVKQSRDISGLRQKITALESVKVEVTNSPTISVPVLPEPISTTTATTTEEVGNNNPFVTKLKITATPTGWLNVRSEANSAATISGKVYPGEEYSYDEKTTGWYHIQLSDGKSGWVSDRYVSLEK